MPVSLIFFHLLSFNGAALFQVRKELRFFAGFYAIDGLQWGRTFSSAESFAGRWKTIVKWSKLQWGRTFSSAERSPFTKAAVADLPASMGPHFFKCGKVDGINHRAERSLASMGPHFFKCGKRNTPLVDR